MHLFAHVCIKLPATSRSTLTSVRGPPLGHLWVATSRSALGQLQVSSTLPLGQLSVASKPALGHLHASSRPPRGQPHASQLEVTSRSVEVSSRSALHRLEVSSGQLLVSTASAISWPPLGRVRSSHLLLRSRSPLGQCQVSSRSPVAQLSVASKPSLRHI